MIEMRSPCLCHPANQPLQGPCADVVAERPSDRANFDFVPFDENGNIDFGKHAGSRREMIKDAERLPLHGGLSAKRDHRQALETFSLSACLEQIDKSRKLIPRDVVVVAPHDLRLWI